MGGRWLLAGQYMGNVPVGMGGLEEEQRGCRKEG